MHSMNVTLGGFEMELALNFGAARELSQKVGDPLGIAREAALEAMMSNAGIVHQPKWVPTVENVPLILWIGAKHSGSTVKLEDVQEAVFTHGFIESKVVAIDYLACICTPTARERSEAGSKADAGE